MNYIADQIKKAIKRAVTLSESAIIAAITALIVGAVGVILALIAYFK